MAAEFAELHPEQATEDDLRACYDIMRTVYQADFPEQPVPTYDTYKEEMRLPTSILGMRRTWVARTEGVVVATATVVFPEPENDNLTITTVRVPHAHRRKGIATALLGAVLPAMRAENRTLVTGQGLIGGRAGELWASHLGFSPVQEFLLQDLRVPDTDPRLWQVPAPAGFHAERWVDAAPENIVERYATARTAITDAPTAESSLRQPAWTVERVRAHEAEATERGSQLWVVAAVHESTGAVAGLTEIEVPALRTHQAYQLDTAVPTRFRGHGLGRFIKADMLRWLTAERPLLEWVYTNTDSHNAHMIRVNQQIGYVDKEVVLDVEADINALDKRLRQFTGR
jgi:mycothiol synthase